MLLMAQRDPGTQLVDVEIEVDPIKIRESVEIRESRLTQLERAS